MLPRSSKSELLSGKERTRRWRLRARESLETCDVVPPQSSGVKRKRNASPASLKRRGRRDRKEAASNVLDFVRQCLRLRLLAKASLCQCSDVRRARRVGQRLLRMGWTRQAVVLLLSFDVLWRSPRVSKVLLEVCEKKVLQGGCISNAWRAAVAVRTQQSLRTTFGEFWHGPTKLNMAQCWRAWRPGQMHCWAQLWPKTGKSVNLVSLTEHLKRDLAFAHLGPYGRVVLVRTIARALALALTHDDAVSPQMSTPVQVLSSILPPAEFLRRAKSLRLKKGVVWDSADVALLYCEVAKLLKHLGIVPDWDNTQHADQNKYEILTSPRCKLLLRCLRRCSKLDSAALFRQSKAASAEAAAVDRFLPAARDEKNLEPHTSANIEQRLPLLNRQLQRLGFKTQSS